MPSVNIKLPFHELDNKNFEEPFLHQIPLLNKITDKMTDSIDNFCQAITVLQCK